MKLWFDLLFGNPVGLFSVITVVATAGIISYLLYMFFKKSGEKPPNTLSHR